MKSKEFITDVIHKKYNEYLVKILDVSDGYLLFKWNVGISLYGLYNFNDEVLYCFEQGSFWIWKADMSCWYNDEGLSWKSAWEPIAEDNDLKWFKKINTFIDKLRMAMI